MRFVKGSALLLSASISLAPLAGCESLPGNEKQQGTVIGGAGGAAAGAAIGGKDHCLAGAVIGGVLGAGGGYLVGAKVQDKNNKSEDQVRQEAQAAAEKAKANPATPEDVKTTNTADLNNDGFVTLDEVAALKKAGLSDKEQIRRLERTQQYFQLTSAQQDYLRQQGVSDQVIDAMRDMKPNEAGLASDKDDNGKNPDVDMQTNPR
ncbi:MAG: hypothetical protein QOE14_2193 [Humisphaera sp.]|nr:hypothetical protein [Humisphaera sp.]